MPQPACVACRWGTGTTCEKPAVKTSASKEVEDKFAAMQKERKQQDERWFAPPSAAVEAAKTTTTGLKSTSGS